MATDDEQSREGGGGGEREKGAGNGRIEAHLSLMQMADR